MSAHLRVGTAVLLATLAAAALPGSARISLPLSAITKAEAAQSKLGDLSKFRAVVVDPDYPAFFLSQVATDNHYASDGPLFKPDDEFWSWRSGRTPRADVYVPAAG